LGVWRVLTQVSEGQHRPAPPINRAAVKNRKNFVAIQVKPGGDRPNAPLVTVQTVGFLASSALLEFCRRRA
jgi:hypothetical protein